MTTHAEMRVVRNQRAEKMAQMYRQGLTLADIGRQFNVTRERVRQLLRIVGVKADEGGQAVRTRTVKATTVSKQRLAQAKQEAKHGVPYELLRELRACGATRAFQEQRRNAKDRGVSFRLTLAEWWAVWQASGKFHLRGRGIGHYCMSRIRDDGHYELGNVHVQLNEENGREAVAKWNGKKKTIRGVFCLYPGRDKAWLAKYGDIPLGYFSTAEEAGAAREAYMQANGKRSAGLGRGRGWTLLKGARSKPYMVQVVGTKDTTHATQEEAEAEYARRCAEVMVARSAQPVSA